MNVNFLTWEKTPGWRRIVFLPQSLWVKTPRGRTTTPVASVWGTPPETGRTEKNMKVQRRNTAFQRTKFVGHLSISPPDCFLYPESASQLRIWQLSGQLEIFKADPFPGPLVPCEQHGQLEGGHLQVVLANLILKGYLEKRATSGFSLQSPGSIQCQ